MAAGSYDPKKILLTFGGVPVTGYADGTGIEVERSNPTWSISTGMDDLTAYTKRNDTSGKITITLQQISLTNDVLSGFMLLDETANGGLFPILVKDILGLSESSGIGRIEMPPTQGFSNDVSTREWSILCSGLSIFVGGNLI